MKNIKHLLAATVALVSVSSFANLFQPHVATKEDAPIRITAGAQGGLIYNKIKDSNKGGFGANNLGGGLSFTHNVGYDFEYGLGIGGSYASYDSPAFRIFNDESKDMTGLRLDVELLARFMPELADSFRLGGLVGVGYSHLFGVKSKMAEEAAKQIKFGDLALRVGLPVSYGFSDMVSVYFAPSYALTAIRFHAEGAAKEAKDYSMLSGLELPLGFWFEVADNVGLYIEANNRFMNFKKFGESWKLDSTLGVSFAI